jgi:hypothetical protein
MSQLNNFFDLCFSMWFFVCLPQAFGRRGQLVLHKQKSHVIVSNPSPTEAGPLFPPVSACPALTV